MHVRAPELMGACTMGADDPGKTREQLIEEVRALRTETAALRERHAVLQAVTDFIPDAVFVRDARCRYLMINAAGARLLGRSIEEVLGEEASELVPPGTACPSIEDDRRIMA